MANALCHSDRKLVARGMCSPCYGRWWRGQNPEKAKEQHHRWYETHKDDHRAYHNQYMAGDGGFGVLLRRYYGISVDYYDRLFKAQDGKCASCGESKPRRTGLHVDHDHRTGRIRGLLCGSCNRAAGLLGDTPDRIIQLARYLEKAGIL
jgi:Recombination endonuclease VII